MSNVKANNAYVKTRLITINEYYVVTNNLLITTKHQTQVIKPESPNINKIRSTIILHYIQSPLFNIRLQCIFIYIINVKNVH